MFLVISGLCVRDDAKLPFHNYPMVLSSGNVFKSTDIISIQTIKRFGSEWVPLKFRTGARDFCFFALNWMRRNKFPKACCTGIKFDVSTKGSISRGRLCTLWANANFGVRLMGLLLHHTLVKRGSLWKAGRITLLSFGTHVEYRACEALDGEGYPKNGCLRDRPSWIQRAEAGSKGWRSGRPKSDSRRTTSYGRGHPLDKGTMASRSTVSVHLWGTNISEWNKRLVQKACETDPNTLFTGWTEKLPAI